MKNFLKIFLFFAAAILGVVLMFQNSESAAAALAVSPIIGNMSREDLEEFAQAALSDNYEGYEDYEGFDDLDPDDMYDGFEDDFVAFLGNSRSFLDEKKSGVYLTFTIVNNSGYSKTVCLNPAYFDTKGLEVDGKGYDAANIYLHNHNIAEMTAAGHSEIHAVITDGLIYGTTGAGITVTGVNGKIQDHLHFCKKNATRVPEIVFSSVVNSTGAIDTTFYSKIMTIRQVSPYRKFGDTNIDLNEFFKVEQYQSGKITVDTHKYNLQMDDQTLVYVEIDNDRKLTVTMKIGGISNAANTIFKKAKKANQNVVKGTAGVVPAGIRKQIQTSKNKQLNLIRKAAFKPIKK
ncbi:MAG TPA: hypothetical protein PLB59_09735 [Bacteroidales bacterium]|nr:hypothetical protein [Bacteroidales bacterium]HQN16671.1 hypothetical protein [Bacteroidales bacterium]HQP16238.1 hypothetical protein [Bacteroidales bacterium]